MMTIDDIEVTSSKELFEIAVSPEPYFMHDGVQVAVLGVTVDNNFRPADGWSGTMVPGACSVECRLAWYDSGFRHTAQGVVLKEDGGRARIRMACVKSENLRHHTIDLTGKEADIRKGACEKGGGLQV